MRALRGRVEPDVDGAQAGHRARPASAGEFPLLLPDGTKEDAALLDLFAVTEEQLAPPFTA